MPTATNGIDWSATAAWIALVISIVGTVASPLITSALNNRHQKKMRELDIKENRLIAAETAKCIATRQVDDVSEFGRTFF